MTFLAKSLDDWLTAATALRKQGTSFVMVTVIAVRGSAPQKPGARLLITADEIIGTIAAAIWKTKRSNKGVRYWTTGIGRRSWKLKLFH